MAVILNTSEFGWGSLPSKCKLGGHLIFLNWFPPNQVVVLDRYACYLIIRRNELVHVVINSSSLFNFNIVKCGMPCFTILINFLLFQWAGFLELRIAIGYI